MMFIDPNGMLAQAVIDRMMKLGGTWHNTGSGFTNSEGNSSMDFDGNDIKWSDTYSNNLLNNIGVMPSGGGSGFTYNITSNGFSFISHWTGGGYIPGGMDLGTAYWKYISFAGYQNISTTQAGSNQNDYYMNYWGLLNKVATAQSYTTNGIGATLGNVARASNNLVDVGKMIKSPNIFKTYNLYRSN
jgi:hypothetical protein